MHVPLTLTELDADVAMDTVPDKGRTVTAVVSTNSFLHCRTKL